MNSSEDYHLVILQFGTSTKHKTLDDVIRPLGADKISWAAQKAGYKAISITRLQCLTSEEQKKIIEPYITKKTVIGISTSLMVGIYYKDETKNPLRNFANVINEIAKKHNNKIILGGQSANEFLTYFYNSTSLENFDGENDITEFLNKEFNYGMNKKHHEFWTIQNDNFKFPENSFVQKEELLPLELSRGCIFSCKFCSFSRIGKQKGSYEKNMSNVKDYIIENYEKYGTQYYFLTSDTVNDNNDRMNEFCDMIETLPFNIYYSGYFRIDLMNKYLDTTRRLFDTGLRGLNFGIETLHAEAAKIIEKPFTGQRAKDFMLKLHYDIFKEQVIMTAGMIVGLPKEPVESIYESFEWYKNEGKVIKTNFNPLTIIDPTRGLQSAHYMSKFSKNAEKYGFRWPNKDNPLYWEHDLLNFKKASVISHKINKTLNHKERIGFINGLQQMACDNNFDFIKNYFKDIERT